MEILSWYSEIMDMGIIILTTCLFDSLKIWHFEIVKMSNVIKESKRYNSINTIFQNVEILKKNKKKKKSLYFKFEHKQVSFILDQIFFGITVTISVIFLPII